jgi:hypothetical protein
MRLIVSIRRALLAIASALTLSGCIAGITAGELTPANDSPDGLRYFLPATYFVVEQTAQGQWDAHLQAVVDRSREFYVQPYAYLASGKTTVEFHPDGTLKSFRLESDSTAVPEAAINAVKDIQLKREELKREEIARRASAGFTAKDKQVMSRGDEGAGDRPVFIYKLDGDKLTGVGAPPQATVTFAVAKAEPPGLPINLDPKALSMEQTDAGRSVAIGLSGIQLTKEEATKRLCFYRQVDEGHLREVEPGRRDGLISDGLLPTGARPGGRLVLTADMLWDIRAVGLRGSDGLCRPS